MGAYGVVLDTNVLVSALGFGGRPLDALLATIDGNHQLFVSEETLTELERVMTYDRLPFTDTDQRQFLAVLRREGECVRPDEQLDIVRDADDDKFLELAVAADADYVVSGDDDLQSVGTYQGIQILTPAAFVSTIT